MEIWAFIQHVLKNSLRNKKIIIVVCRDTVVISEYVECVLELEL